MTAVLKDLRTQNVNASNVSELGRDASETVSVPSSNTGSPHYSEPATGSVVEGQSSLSAHSVFVKDFVQNLIQFDLPGRPDEQIRRTLDALSNIANDSNLRDTVGEPLVVQRDLESHAQRPRRELPPIQKATPLIRLAKGKNHASL